MVHRLQRYFQQCRWTTQRAVAPMLLFCILVVVGVAACGSTVEGAQNPTPPLHVRKCGSVQTSPRGLPLNATMAKQAESCFWQAYQKCQPAMLGFASRSIDTVALHTFSIRPSDQNCSVTDAMQHAIVPAKLSAVKTYTCTGVAAKPDGLHFSGCGDEGDVIMPM
ncbi:hypothetical protein [Ktedonobacter racemifer]|uniref:Uncharacterized protein n=1 Tax=Ktedonobacter racemifer DSM 44963 TaxID=485913 RepID=D6TUY5_KTERA|nr:hypothetical protein [Ktedonobacter racemifer]EFH85311.1 hypothetical protein Krac_6501 [Ktedonobacter racemifer DSM 44963]